MQDLREIGETLELKTEEDEWLESNGHQKLKGYSTKAEDLFLVPIV